MSVDCGIASDTTNTSSPALRSTDNAAAKASSSRPCQMHVLVKNTFLHVSGFEKKQRRWSDVTDAREKDLFLMGTVESFPPYASTASEEQADSISQQAALQQAQPQGAPCVEQGVAAAGVAAAVNKTPLSHTSSRQSTAINNSSSRSTAVGVQQSNPIMQRTSPSRVVEPSAVVPSPSTVAEMKVVQSGAGGVIYGQEHIETYEAEPMPTQSHCYVPAPDFSQAGHCGYAIHHPGLSPVFESRVPSSMGSSFSPTLPQCMTPDLYTPKNMAHHGGSSAHQGRGNSGQGVGSEAQQQQSHYYHQHNHHRNPEPSPAPLPGENTTTLMLRNIPNRFTPELLREAIVERGFAQGECFDFLYMPVDCHTRFNLGYAFINFTNPALAVQFTNDLHGDKLPRFRTHKYCEVSVARVQGLAANLEHLRHSSSVRSLPDEFKPAIIRRDGMLVPYPSPLAANLGYGAPNSSSLTHGGGVRVGADEY